MSDFRLSSRSLERLESVHPNLVEMVKTAIHLSDVDFMVFEGLRSVERQRQYVAAGVSTTMKSKHLRQDDGFSHAVDLVPIVAGRARWEIKPCIRIAEAMQEAYKVGYTDFELVWGGAWAVIGDATNVTVSPEKLWREYLKSKHEADEEPFVDGPHFQLMRWAG